MIDSLSALRECYGEAKGRAVKKQLDHLDRHCLRFISLSPFVVLASGNAAGQLDASPRGGPPGFVRPVGRSVLLIADSPGNNRLDTLVNIVETGHLGLLFMIPGVDETLRVNGRARLLDAPDVLVEFADARRTPKSVIEVTVTDAYLHCAKAFMRSNLWSASSRVERTSLPSMGEMLNDQTGTQAPPATAEAMQARYQADL